MKAYFFVQYHISDKNEGGGRTELAQHHQTDQQQLLIKT